MNQGGPEEVLYIRVHALRVIDDSANTKQGFTPEMGPFPCHGPRMYLFSAHGYTVIRGTWAQVYAQTDTMTPPGRDERTLSGLLLTSQGEDRPEVWFTAGRAECDSAVAG